MSFARWRELSPAAAARRVHETVASLPEPLRRATLAWLTPEASLARELASASDAPLRGVPFLLKDLFDAAGTPTFAGSTFLPEVRPSGQGDAAILSRLRAAGAGFVGKTNLVEFAAGLTGENPHYGDCPHPHFPGLLSGGSSSGSAALVAAGVAPLAVGTDTGGSVRVPAAWCGLYGFRLTPGDDLIRDAVPLSPTLDTAGWFTAGPADMFTAWRFLVENNATPAALDRVPRGCYLRISTLLDGVAPEVASALDRAAAGLCPAADMTTVDELLAAWRGAVDDYGVIVTTEARQYHRDWLTSFRDRYDQGVWARFSTAATTPPERVAQAEAAIERNRRSWHEFFGAFDFLVLPAVPSIAPRKEECTPEIRRRLLTLTAPASLGGLPVLALPVPLPSGHTVGLQVVLPDPHSKVVPWLLRKLQA